MMTVDRLKKYLRIDEDYEDELLEELMEAAKGYIAGAVSNYREYYVRYPEFEAKADLMTAILAGEFYQNRANTAHEMSYTVRSLMAQLQYFPAEEMDSDSGLTAVDTGTLAMFDANGNLFNSGIKLAREEEVEELLEEVGLKKEGGD